MSKFIFPKGTEAHIEKKFKQFVEENQDLSELSQKVLNSWVMGLADVAPTGKQKEQEAEEIQPIIDAVIRKLQVEKFFTVGNSGKIENISISEKDVEEEEMFSPTGQSGQKSRMTILLDVFFKRGIFSFWLDELKIPYVSFEFRNHVEYYPIKSQTFINILMRFFYNECSDILREDEIRNVLNIACAHAHFSNEVRHLSVRCAESGDKYFYDLMCKDWECVRFCEDGWDIEKSPILFRKYSHMLEQDLPDENAVMEDIYLFSEFLNIKNDDENFLLLVWLIASFIDENPHPILILHGAQGSAKSMMARLCRLLIDPSTLKDMSLPHAEKDRIVTLLHNYCPSFDNLRDLKNDVSDLLCRSVTGDAVSMRQLYTDTDEIIIQFRRKLILNGINIPGEAPDLIDRSILIELNRIQKDVRWDEKQMYNKFFAVRPKILGAVFHILCGAIKIKKSLKLPELPRMADFCLWGEAISRSMGEPENRFYRIYLNNIESHLRETIEGDPLGICVLRLLRDGGSFRGSASTLLGDLQKIAELEKIDLKDKYCSFPRQPNTLSRKLNILKTTLAEHGITYERKNEGDKRLIVLETLEKNIVNTDISSEPTLNLNKIRNLTDDKEELSQEVSSEVTDEIKSTDDKKNIVSLSSGKNSNKTPLNIQFDDKTIKMIKKEELHKCSFADCLTQTELKTPSGASVCLKHLKQQAEMLFASEGKPELPFSDFIAIVTPEADKKMLKDGFWIEQHHGERMLQVNAKDNYS